jgi:hypothetical protein
LLEQVDCRGNLKLDFFEHLNFFANGEKFFCGHAENGIEFAGAASGFCVWQMGDGGMELEELFDFLKGEAEFLAPLDEEEIFEVGRRVDAVAGGGAVWVGEDATSFVETDGLDTDAGLGGELADAHEDTVNPIAGYRVKRLARTRRLKWTDHNAV